MQKTVDLSEYFAFKNDNIEIHNFKHDFNHVLKIFASSFKNGKINSPNFMKNLLSDVFNLEIINNKVNSNEKLLSLAMGVHLYETSLMCNMISNNKDNLNVKSTRKSLTPIKSTRKHQKTIFGRLLQSKRVGGVGTPPKKPEKNEETDLQLIEVVDNSTEENDENNSWSNFSFYAFLSTFIVGSEHQNRQLVVTDKSLRIKYVEYILFTIGAVVICILIFWYMPDTLAQVQACRSTASILLENVPLVGVPLETQLAYGGSWFVLNVPSQLLILTSYGLSGNVIVSSITFWYESYALLRTTIVRNGRQMTAREKYFILQLLYANVLTTCKSGNLTLAKSFFNTVVKGTKQRTKDYNAIADSAKKFGELGVDLIETSVGGGVIKKTTSFIKNAATKSRVKDTTTSSDKGGKERTPPTTPPTKPKSSDIVVDTKEKSPTSSDKGGKDTEKKSPENEGK